VAESGIISVNGFASAKLVILGGGLSNRLTRSHIGAAGIVGHEFKHLNGLTGCGGDTDFGHSSRVAAREGAMGVGRRERGVGLQS
jgi:hypothetical protein